MLRKCVDVAARAAEIPVGTSLRAPSRTGSGRKIRCGFGLKPGSWDDWRATTLQIRSRPAPLTNSDGVKSRGRSGNLTV